MRPEVNSNRFEISLQDKISLRCEVTSLSALTWLWGELKLRPRLHETLVNSNRFEISLRGRISLRCEVHFGSNFTSVKLTEVKFQAAVSFPCKQ